MRSLGIDSNSKKIAWVIVEDGVLHSYGEIFFKDTYFNKRLGSARKLLEDAVPLLFNDIDYIGFERAIKVNSASTVIMLAEMFGVIKSVLTDIEATLVEVTPIAWQTWCGNPNITGEKRRELISSHPELKTKTQVSAFIRNYRKNVTLDFIERKTGIRMPNDDLSDAAGIAFFIDNKMREVDGES